jgi:protein-L-isoaspartate(D-aspartate) O-methyltransferase
MKESDFAILRDEMVTTQILARGIKDPLVLDAFGTVPRHLFIPDSRRNHAYQDYPLPIGEDQTISQPYMVALMTKCLAVESGMSVLEIGTGSGYQAAILSYMGATVYSIERFPYLAQQAKKTLDSLGYSAEVTTGDGTLGWSAHAPYDRIIVTAASPNIPPPLIEQLKVAGRMVIPLGMRFTQNLTIVHKISESKIEDEYICGCVFVPLIGEYGYKE